MGCIINYWSCKFREYEEIYTEETGEDRFYFCTHPKGDGVCNKNNKFGDAEEFCELAEEETTWSH